MIIKNQNYFSEIDTPEKAYILGFIASDGSISHKTIRIEIHKKDKEILTKIKNSISEDLKIRSLLKRPYIRINLCSIKMVKDVCRHLQISIGKKSDIVSFPQLDLNLVYPFIRGYFDGDGTITDPNTKTGGILRCDITSNSIKMLQGIKNATNAGRISKNHIYWYSNNALDFLYKLYENSTIHMNRKYNLYIKWKDWVPGLSGNGNYGYELTFGWKKTIKDAFPPQKTRASDSGYDLTLITLEKVIGNILIYDTGIKVRPEYGWYFELVGRSSIIKSGYMLANSVGIIDRTYTGSIKVALLKINEEAKDLILPSKLVQIIPKPIIHLSPIEDKSEDNTERGTGGFGSTNSE